MAFLGAQEVQIITTCVIKKAVDVVSFFKFIQEAFPENSLKHVFFSSDLVLYRIFSSVAILSSLWCFLCLSHMVLICDENSL